MTSPGFGKINFILTLAGHRISASKTWIHLVRRLFSLLCISRLVAGLIIDVMHYPDREEISMLDLSNTLLTISAILFHISVEFKYSSISGFIMKYKSLMTNEYQKRVELVGRQSLAFFCLFFVIEYLMTFCYSKRFILCEFQKTHTFMSSRNMTLMDAIFTHTNVVYECLLLECWMAMSFCLFNYCLTLKQEVIRCKLNHLIILITSRDSDRSMRRLESVTSFIQTIQDEFESCFCIFPFLVFAANFMQASGFLMYKLTSQEDSVWGTISTVITSMMWLIVPLLMSMTAHSSLIEKVAKRVILLLQKPNMTAYDTCIIHEIREIADRKESAWLFELDKLVILPFVGHVISFSALFMQLTTPKEHILTSTTGNLSLSSFY